MMNVTRMINTTALKTATKSIVATIAVWGMGMQAVHACASTPYLGELCTVGFNFCPKGWAPANGQLLPISQNAALFALLGTMYGGNGTTTFALPNMQGRMAVDSSSAIVQGQSFGSSTTTLTVAQMPAHTHVFTPSSTPLTVALNASTAAGTSGTPAGGNYLGMINASSGAPQLYAAGPGNVPLGGVTATGTLSGTVGATGSSQPVPIQPPSLVMTMCIALTGIFPSRN